MLFNTIEFAIFLPIVFLLYWFVTDKNLKLQNSFLLLASYVFYGWWDWRFLGLIIFSSLADFYIGIHLFESKNEKKRKWLLYASLFINLGFLGFFKYFNFFAQNFVEAFTLFGQTLDPVRLSIILPVGISFYTFQTLSYSIDVYRRKLEPTYDIISFFAFVSFFPQLVAGPIERATNLLPQFYSKRTFEYNEAADGMRQILWGLFKKIVIADNCAVFANQIFANSADLNGSTLVLGAIFFTFQIYGDFSGYSDIAIGTARLFGFKLAQNFAFPYFSRDIAEFWRRWHISLSTWFRDYLYIPLGGSKGGTGMRVRNTFVIFVVSGFWHGANWTFIAWGALNALYFLPLLLANNNRKNLDVVAQGRLLPSFREAISMGTTFGLTVLAWVFFRAESISQALTYLKTIFSTSIFQIPIGFDRVGALYILVIIFVFLLVEWFGRDRKHAFEDFGKTWHAAPRIAVYYIIVFLLLWFHTGGKQQFIYFQF